MKNYGSTNYRHDKSWHIWVISNLLFSNCAYHNLIYDVYHAPAYSQIQLQEMKIQSFNDLSNSQTQLKKREKSQSPNGPISYCLASLYFYGFITPNAMEWLSLPVVLGKVKNTTSTFQGWDEATWDKLSYSIWWRNVAQNSIYCSPVDS